MLWKKASPDIFSPWSRWSILFTDVGQSLFEADLIDLRRFFPIIAKPSFLIKATSFNTIHHFRAKFFFHGDRFFLKEMPMNIFFRWGPLFEALWLFCWTPAARVTSSSPWGCPAGSDLAKSKRFFLAFVVWKLTLCKGKFGNSPKHSTHSLP